MPSTPSWLGPTPPPSLVAIGHPHYGTSARLREGVRMRRRRCYTDDLMETVVMIRWDDEGARALHSTVRRAGDLCLLLLLPR